MLALIDKAKNRKLQASIPVNLGIYRSDSFLRVKMVNQNYWEVFSLKITPGAKHFLLLRTQTGFKSS